MAGSLGLSEGSPSAPAESLRIAPCRSWSASWYSLRADSEMSARVGARISALALAVWARCARRERAKVWGSDTACCLSSSRALRSRLLFSRWSWSRDMAERRAIASGFSLSSIGTEGGCGWKVAARGGTTREGGRDSVGCLVCSRGASCAAEMVGVIGDTGGRSGDDDLECGGLGWREGVDDELGEVERVVVSTRSAGMAARRGRAGEGRTRCRGRRRWWRGAPAG